MNLYQMPVDEVPFMFWCQRVLSEDVAQNCQGTGEGTTEDENKCGIQRLAEVQVFLMREFVAPGLLASPFHPTVSNEWQIPGKP